MPNFVLGRSAFSFDVCFMVATFTWISVVLILLLVHILIIIRMCTLSIELLVWKLKDNPNRTDCQVGV